MTDEVETFLCGLVFKYLLIMGYGNWNLIHNFMGNLQVGSADALAFYLPGVVSQIGKVLHVSKSMSSGAAGSTEALDHAIRGFTEYLIVVLEDNVNISSLGIIANDGCGLSSSEEKPYASLLEELRHLPVKNQGEDEITAKDLMKSVVEGITVPGFREKAHGDSDRKVGSLRVKRTREWITNTSAHVDKLLCATFPHVGYHSCGSTVFCFRLNFNC